MTTLFLKISILHTLFNFQVEPKKLNFSYPNTLNVNCKIVEQDTDTLRVSQKDTAYFMQQQRVESRPCSKARLVMHYELKNPIPGNYYFIYNTRNVLIMEGLYSSEFTLSGTFLEGFFNSKMYYYRKNNTNLEMIYYQKDGRWVKIEFYNRKRRLSSIKYFDGETPEGFKTEIYKNGKLRKTILN